MQWFLKRTSLSPCIVSYVLLWTIENAINTQYMRNLTMFTRSKCNMDEIFGLKFNFPSFFFDIPPFTKKVIFVPEFVILQRSVNFEMSFWYLWFSRKNEPKYSTLLLWYLKSNCFCSIFRRIEATKKPFWN